MSLNLQKASGRPLMTKANRVEEVFELQNVAKSFVSYNCSFWAVLFSFENLQWKGNTTGKLLVCFCNVVRC